MRHRTALYLLPALSIALVAATPTCPSATAAGLRVIEDDQGLLVQENGADVLFYQRAPTSIRGQYRRANYIHPLYDLDGNILTEDFPPDHLHHRGIFWAWHQVWIGTRKIGDPWVATDFSWDVRSAEVQWPDLDSCVLRLGVVWNSPAWTDRRGRPMPIVKETTRIRVHRAAHDARQIDFQIHLLAVAKDVRIGGSEDEKGYGGFSTRFRLPQDIHFTGPDGAVRPQTLSVQAGPWLDMSARFGKTDNVSGITILCHPTLPQFPPPWILRQRDSMQNPVYPGRQAVSLSQTTPLVLRYRVVLHRGDAQPSQIERWQAEYAATEPMRW